MDRIVIIENKISFAMITHNLDKKGAYKLHLRNTFLIKLFKGNLQIISNKIMTVIISVNNNN